MGGQQRGGAEATPGEAQGCSAPEPQEEEYVFAGNARRWRYWRAALLASGTGLAALGGLLLVLCLEPPDLPDLGLRPSVPASQSAGLRASAAHREARRVARSDRSLLRRLSRIMSPHGRRRKAGVRHASAHLIHLGRRL